MSRLHKKDQIGNYEERWQKRFYRPAGDGKHYIHVCEICLMSGSERIPGGHYLCEGCKKKLRLPKEETIIRWGKGGLKNSKDLNLKYGHPSNPSKIERAKTWRKIIRIDYLIELFNKHFEYEH